MQKVMLALLKTFLMWIFFMLYPGHGHEDFNWIKMIGMLLLAIGTIWYIKLDFKDIEVMSAECLSTKNDSQIDLSIGKDSIKSVPYQSMKLEVEFTQSRRTSYVSR